MSTGLWLVGARGSVATTAVVGALAVRAGLAARNGLVTESPAFAEAGLPPLEGFVFGGHDVTAMPLAKRAEALGQAGVVPRHLPAVLADELDQVDARIRPGGRQEGETQAEHAARLAADIRSFAQASGVDRVVVVNVASTEPPAEPHPAHASLDALETALEQGATVLPTSSLYAYAALQAGSAFVDFTPSTGARLPALDELARRERLPYAGSDGKTGETLVKSTLAPMFQTRELHVQSWVGMNILGGGDGATLADPHASLSKTRSKGRSVAETLGYEVVAPVHIDNVPDMGEWKTAWDHIAFEGFLGVRMTMQFTWQGCDSALAAPLVLDLARLAARAAQAGESGPLPALGFFFKDPVASSEHRLATQYDVLVAWARDLAGRSA
ncbi:inositol-3-phosphate synthase [Motilibacter deserti]|uniref:Myo-inositol-1-phosphate synthase n=1 Tax=Motilibacter deserti TaxID=2714956 RepID=A0ABX0GU67_9ACTN|nr:myo-inositol-1-phosphate synthase [Motilibacter deserti]